MSNQNSTEGTLEKQRVPSRRKKIGIILMTLSFVFFGGLLIVPFTPFDIGTKAVISLTLVILGEGSFWVGGFILGKEYVAKYKQHLNPVNWFRGQRNPEK